MLIQDHIKLPTFPEFLLSPQGKVHPLTENNNLTLGVWKIYLEVTQQQNYQKLLQTYTSKHGDQAHKLLIKVPGENGLAGVVNNHLILFRPLTNIVECLSALSLAGIVEIPGRLGALYDLELTSVTESNNKIELAKLGLSELLWISLSSLWQDISLLKRMGAYPFIFVQFRRKASVARLIGSGFQLTIFFN
jgi:hypothetical protein